MRELTDADNVWIMQCRSVYAPMQNFTFGFVSLDFMKIYQRMVDAADLEALVLGVAAPVT